MPIVKLPGGQLRDEIRMPLYDTINQAAAEAATGTRVFFQSISGKPLAWTNLRQPGSLETAVSYRIQGMSIDASNVNLANQDLLEVVKQFSSLRLHVGEKDYWNGPMNFAAGRLKQNAAITATTQTAPGAAVTAAILNQHYGDEAIQGVMFPGDHFVDINPLQNFFVEWVCGAGTAPFAMSAAEIAQSTPAAGTRVLWMLSLKGLQRRPVQ